MTSRHIQVRPNNVSSDATISFSGGFPVVSWTIPSQNALLNPQSIRINGELVVYKNALGNATSPVYSDDPVADQVTMDNRLGIYAVMDQLIVRHDKSKQVVETIMNYNRYLQSYIGLTSSKQDLMGHMGESALTMPNAESMFEHVIANGDAAGQVIKPKQFSVYTPSGFTQGSAPVNLMDSGFGAVTIEIRLSPDSNCLFARRGHVGANINDAHYVLRDLSLSCTVVDLSADEISTMSQQTSGQMSFNTITSLYTTINSTNAQLQYSLGLHNLQSVFMNFCPSSNINTLTQNGLSTTYPSQAGAGGDLVEIKSVQFLKGGVNYPADYTIDDNSTIPGNVTDANRGIFQVGDPQTARMFMDAVIPEAVRDKTSITPDNYGSTYKMTNSDAVETSYKAALNGGGLFGLGVRMSQFQMGEDYSSEQFGVSLDTTLTSDNPMSVFLYFKSKATLMWSPQGVNLLQ